MSEKSDELIKFSPETSADILNHVLGDFGMFQLRIVLIIFLYKITAAWFMSCIIFTAPELFPGEYTCVLEPNEIASEDECRKRNNDSNIWSKCEHWNYNYSVFTLNQDFELTCHKEIYIALTQFWHLVGILVGGFFATIIMRTSFGRPRRFLLLTMIAQICFGYSTGFASSYTIHCFLRCMSAICCSIMLTCGQVIFSDYTGGTKYRHGVIQLYDTYWSLGVMHISSSNRLYKWDHIYIFITSPTILMFILTIIWVPEDIRWLLIHKNGKEDLAYVQKILMKAALLNDRTVFVPKNLTEELTRLRDQIYQPSANWCLLWRNNESYVQIIIIHIALSIFVVNFNGLLLNTRSFGRSNLKEYAILSAFSEILGCIISLFLSLKFQSIKWQLAGFLNIIAGIIGCLGWIIPKPKTFFTDTVYWILISCCEKMATSVAQSMLLGCLSEVVGPKAKYVLMFSAVTCARICLLSAPFLNGLKSIDTAASLTTFSAMGIIGGFIMCFMTGTPKI